MKTFLSDWVPCVLRPCNVWARGSTRQKHHDRIEHRMQEHIPERTHNLWMWISLMNETEILATCFSILRFPAWQSHTISDEGSPLIWAHLWMLCKVFIPQRHHRRAIIFVGDGGAATWFQPLCSMQPHVISLLASSELRKSLEINFLSASPYLPTKESPFPLFPPFFTIFFERFFYRCICSFYVCPRHVHQLDCLRVSVLIEHLIGTRWPIGNLARRIMRGKNLRGWSRIGLGRRYFPSLDSDVVLEK